LKQKKSLNYDFVHLPKVVNRNWFSSDYNNFAKYSLTDVKLRKEVFIDFFQKGKVFNKFGLEGSVNYDDLDKKKYTGGSFCKPSL